jgi:gas vesicle protein
MFNGERESTSAGFALGVMVGALAGAGLALLFAPKPGAQLRGELGESITTMRDAAARRLRNLADQAGAGMADLQSSVGKMKDTVSGAARDAVTAAAEQTRPDVRPRA